MKRKIFLMSLVVVLGLSLALAGCSSSTSTPTSTPAPADNGKGQIDWLQSYITEVEPIMMQEVFLETLGQINEPIPYYYEEVVKLSGHSCGAIAGAWTITEKALKELYGDETPKRGQIKIYMPGPADEWYIGVFGEVFTYLTGAAPESGFPGTGFGDAIPYNRRNLMTYPEEQSGKLPAMLEYVFERTDTGKKVGVIYNLGMVEPLSTPEITAMQAKVVNGTATPEERTQWVKWWNDRALNTLTNKDQEGFFKVRVIEEGK